MKNYDARRTLTGAPRSMSGPPTQEDVDEELASLDAPKKARVQFVAEWMAMIDVNAGIGYFKGMPFSAQCDYLHDARNAVEGMEEYEKQNAKP